MTGKFALFWPPLSIIFALGACSDETSPDGDDVSTPCRELDEDECAERSVDGVDEASACHPVNGRNTCEGITDTSAPWAFVICEEGGDGDGAAITCATNPDTGDTYTFPSTGIPSGWTETNCSVAAAACELGGAGGGD